MKTILRLAVVSCAGTAALALASNALATQRLAVAQTATGVTIKISQDQSDAQPAKITTFVPAGYTVKPTGAVGATIGTASGQVFATDPNVNLALNGSGDVLVADESKLPAAQVAACSPGPHLAVWDVHLTVFGQALDLYVYVTATSAAETALGTAKLEVCLPPVDVPVGTPGRAPNGAKLLDATFTVNNQLALPVGSKRWTSLWTPYAAGTGKPDTAGTVEARSVVGQGAVTIVGRVTSRLRKLLLITGRVTQSGLPVAKIHVRLFINAKARFSTTTRSDGAYSFRLRNTRRRATTSFFQAVVTVAARDITGTACTDPTPGAKCVSATASPFTATSRKIRVRL
jgi:hypothetical protein